MSKAETAIAVIFSLIVSATTITILLDVISSFGAGREDDNILSNIHKKLERLLHKKH